MVENINSNWVVLWSEQQQCFHYETVEKMLESNISSFKRCKPNQYVPLAFFKSDKDARQAIKKLKQFRADLEGDVFDEEVSY
ncbi:hypothetical protein [Pseudoalteromonas sp. PB2-1]|uniref:hypothetical protein n=1 Tax=Pseudoalteromonas sp. PB2-1 TaxID=2907242 RepID=UPI00386A0729